MDDSDLDPEAVELLRHRAKQYLRKRMRHLRSAVPASALAERDQRLRERLEQLPEFQAASSIALFAPIGRLSEVDLEPLDSLARGQGKRVCYPGGTPDAPELFFTDNFSDLTDAGQGYRQPPLNAPRANPGDVDIIIAPALAASGDGHRLGYGGGYYDRLLIAHPAAVSVVVVRSFQLLAEVPHTAADVKCRIIVTDDSTVHP